MLNSSRNDMINRRGSRVNINDISSHGKLVKLDNYMVRYTKTPEQCDH